MRAHEPDREGYVVRERVRVFYEVFGEEHSARPAVLLLPAWSVGHSRLWKAQVPYLARSQPRDHFRRARQRSLRSSARLRRPMATRNSSPMPWRCWMRLPLSKRCWYRSRWARNGRCMLAAEHADRVAGAVFIGPSLPISPYHEYRVMHSFDDVLDTDEGWAKYNRHYWVRTTGDFWSSSSPSASSSPIPPNRSRTASAGGSRRHPRFCSRSGQSGPARGQCKGERGARARAGGARTLPRPGDPRRCRCHHPARPWGWRSPR